MKKISLVLSFAASLACTNAFAEGDWYGSIKAGANFPDLSYVNDGWQLDAAIGYSYLLEEYYSENAFSLRFEFNPGFQTNSHSGPGGAGDIGRFMGNVLVDYPLIGCSYVYGGLGMGGAYYMLPSLGDDFVFAYQAMAGIGFIVDEGVHLEVGYRFFSSEDQDMGGISIKAPKFHSVEAGIRFEF
ncbi:outer membrane protein [Cerasicoccus frondis]|uniref:outer membrane protein n=1 Tax=Cerasicoccus frondis TaxID=490090 RepID=UPI002852551C|nr:hypothetical protein [Cerasicoccus frondis]